MKLFGVGLMYQSVFSLTRNLLVIWPFFHAVGVTLEFSVNLGEVARVSTAFPWTVGSLALMAASGALLVWLARRRVGRALGDSRAALLNKP